MYKPNANKDIPFKIQIRHFRQRYEERTGKVLTRADLNRVLYECINGTVAHRDQHEIMILVTVDEEQYFVVYNVIDDVPVTLLPASWRKSWLENLEGGKQDDTETLDQGQEIY